MTVSGNTSKQWPLKSRNWDVIRKLRTEHIERFIVGFELCSIHFGWCELGEKSAASPFCGFTDGGAKTQKGRTTQPKEAHLELILRQIADFYPVISRSTTVKNSTSLASVWQTIRMDFGFQSSGADFLDFNSYVLGVMNALGISTSDPVYSSMIACLEQMSQLLIIVILHQSMKSCPQCWKTWMCSYGFTWFTQIWPSWSNNTTGLS